MSLTTRYDTLLCDMMQLLQEGILRYFNSKPTDIDKFKFYFNQCYQQMRRLQQEFHHMKLRFTFQLARLKEFCEEKPVKRLQTKDNEQTVKSHKLDKSSQTQGRYYTGVKQTQNSQQLVSIQQQNEPQTKILKKKRIETARGIRKQKSTIQSAHQRPMTTQQNHNNKLKRYQSKTIDPSMALSFRETEHSRKSRKYYDNKQADKSNLQSPQKGEITLSPTQFQTRRRDLYQELEKSRDDVEPQALNEAKIAALLKRRAKSQQKWNKISRLL